MKKYLVKVGTLLSLVLAFTFLFVGIFSSSNRVYAAWSGKGNGTADNPYQIGTKEELGKFRDIVNGTGEETKNLSVCGKLTADIDLNNEAWTPIGNTISNKYQGTFDGNKKTIKGLSISGTNDFVGLFGRINAATIKDLTVEGSVSGGEYVGGIVGDAQSDDDFATITGCISNVTVTGVDYVGGFVGYASLCIVSNCRNIGNITGTSDNNVGGTGGIVGKIYHSTTISNCFNTGKIVSVRNAGGIVGFNYSNVTSYNWSIINCYNTGDIEVTVGYAGGITSYNNGNVEKCHNVGKVITPTGTDDAEYAGGIIGYFDDNPTAPSNCYYLKGCVQGKTDRAARRYEGLSNPTLFEGNYLSASSFKDSASFKYWDFTDVWMMGTDYPVFIPKHDHELTYEVNGATITATCSAEGCPLENNQATLTLVSPENLECDGNAKDATFEAGYNTTVFPNATINYFKDNKAVNECVYPGTYVAKVTFGNVTAEVEFTIEGHYHDGIIYKKWEATDSLPTTAGNYYLANDVILSSTWNVPGEITICLNGHGIIGNGSTGMMIYATTVDARLVIDDCSNTEHKYSVADADLYNGAGLATVNDNLTENYLTFKGGYITGSNSNTNEDFAAITAVNDGVIIINGGTIIGNKNTKGQGAALYSSDDGILVIKGGSIIHNLCQQAAVFSCDYGILFISGGVIAYNASVEDSMAGVNTDDTADLNMSGSPLIKNNYGPNNTGVDLRLETPIYFGVDFNPKEKIGVQVKDNIDVFTTNWNIMGEKDPYDYFFSQDSGKPYIGLKNGNLALFAEKQVARVGNNTYESLLTAYNACAENETIKLLEDIDLTQENVTISIANSITIDLNGKILKFAENQIVLSGSANLTIDNSKIKTGGINGIIPETASASVTFKNARTNYTSEEIDASSYLKLADGFVAVNINEDGSADTNVFKTIICSSKSVAEIKRVFYPSFEQAYNDWEEGDVIKLLADLDLTGKGTPYLTINKNIVIDLNGHIITSDDGGVIYIYEKNHIEIFNSVDSAGGFKGGINPIIKDISKEYAYVVFGVGVRFPVEAEQLDFDNLVIFRLADEYIVKNINADKSADENGFISIIGKPYTPLDPNGTPTVNKPDHTPLYVGDEITVSTDATSVVIKWYYVDENGNPTGDPIGEETTYTIKKPNDLGKKIVAVIIQNEDENGDPYEEGKEPTQTTDVFVVYKPIDAEEKVEINTTRTNPVNEDEISVTPSFTPSTVKWYYVDVNGNPTGNPIGEGTTYTIKCPDPNDENHDDTAHTIIAVISQDKDEFGNPYDDDKKPFIKTNGVKVYTPLDTTTKTSIQTPNHDPLFEGDEIEVVTNATDVTYEWFYTDENGNPTGEPIGTKNTYTIKNPNDLGKKITAVITQNKKSDGTDYDDADKPKQYSNFVTVYKPLDTNPDVKPQIEGLGDKPKAENMDVLEVNVDTKPVDIKWYYDDDNDGLPDDLTKPLGSGNLYTVVTPDQKDPTHDDQGHTIIAVITQPKKPDGTNYPEGEVPTLTTAPVVVKGVIGGFTPLDNEEEPTVSAPDHNPLLKGDEIEIDIDANPVRIEWFYDDNNDGLPDDPANPIAEGNKFKVTSGDPANPNRDDIGHNVIARITQDKDQNGNPVAEGNETVIYSLTIELYKPLTAENVDVTTPTHTPLVTGDEIKVETKATDITVKWYYDDDNDGLPDDLENPIGEGTTYTIKRPDSNDENHDDTGHTIIAVITQNTDEFGNTYDDDKKPVIKTNGVKVYIPLDTTTKTSINAPNHDPLFEGDEIEVVTNATDVTYEWFYTDENGNPTGEPIGTKNTYTIKNPNDLGKKITAVITQNKKSDGTDYDDADKPKQYSNIVTVYEPLDTNPDVKPQIEGLGDKLKAENMDVLEVNVDTKPVDIKWYYDDNNDGLPDDQAKPLGSGNIYTVVTPDQKDPTHDDQGHTIIAVITQPKKPDGTNYPEGEVPTLTTEAVVVKGVIGGYTPLDNEEEPTVSTPDHNPLLKGDEIEIDIDANPVRIEWFYDDNNDGLPDDLANPIAEGNKFKVTSGDPTNPNRDDIGHNVVARITQDKDQNGDPVAEGNETVIYSPTIELYKPLTAENVDVTTPTHTPLVTGDEIKVETKATGVTVKWYYDDDENGEPDDLENPVGEGLTYILGCPDENDPTHDDRDHIIIAVITQNTDEAGNDYTDANMPKVTLTNLPDIIPSHKHNFTYKADGATITAKCTTPDCPITEGLTLTLVAPSGSMVYDGKARVVTFKEGYNEEVFAGAVIKYFKGNEEVTTCVDAATYTAKVTFADATAKLNFTIENWKEKDNLHNEVQAEIVGASQDETVHLKVEIKTTVSAQETQTDFEKIKKLLANNEAISSVYDIKLIRTVNGQNTEIQPSDIKEGTTIIVTMTIPAELVGTAFRILHIHSVDDAEFITNYTTSINKVSFTVNRLSEFAFVYTKVDTNHGFCVGWVLFIFVILEAALLLAYVPKVLVKLNLLDKQALLQNIGLFVSVGLMVFGIVAIIVDTCPISIVSYSLAMAIGVCHMVFVILKIRKITNK